MKAFLRATGFVCFLLGSAPVAAEPYQLTLAGASPGGLWSLLGIGVDRAVSLQFPGSTITYQTSGGGIANVALLSQSQVELGLVTNAELLKAMQGTQPFQQPYRNMRAIAYLYNWSPMHFVMDSGFARANGIESISDIASMQPAINIAFNRRGNVSSEIAELMLSVAGVEASDIDNWGGQVILAPANEQANLLRDGRIHALLNADFIGRATLMELATSIDVTFLKIEEHISEEVADSMGLDLVSIPSGSYPGQEHEINSVGLGAMLVATEELADDIAYDITRALLNNISEIQSVHPEMEKLSPEFMISQEVIPFHDGALRAYSEAGLEQP